MIRRGIHASILYLTCNRTKSEQTMEYAMLDEHRLDSCKQKCCCVGCIAEDSFAFVASKEYMIIWGVLVSIVEIQTVNKTKTNQSTRKLFCVLFATDTINGSFDECHRRTSDRIISIVIVTTIIEIIRI